MTEPPREPHRVPVRDREATPHQREVSVIMEQQPVDSPWIDAQWRLRAVLPGLKGGTDVSGDQNDRATSRQALLRFDGFRLTLYTDECESYYHNLNVPEPQCFVVFRQDDAATPEPALVTASFDAANAYAEGDDLVDATPLDPNLYLWIEEFVLTHYVPTKRKKRKREAWKRS